MNIIRWDKRPKTVSIWQITLVIGSYVVYLILLFLLFTKTKGIICSLSLIPVIIIAIYVGMKNAIMMIFIYQLR